MVSELLENLKLTCWVIKDNISNRWLGYSYTEMLDIF